MLLVLFLWGLRVAEGRVGRRLPVNIWTWVRAGVGQSRGLGWRSGCPSLQTQALGNPACAPSRPRTRQRSENQKRCRGRVYRGHSWHLRQGWAANREACGNPSPKSRAEGGDRGAENREKMGEAAGGQAGSMAFLAPSSSG